MKIVLELELDQVNQIISVMAKEPYQEVFTVLGDISTQASAQLVQQAPEFPESPGELE